MQMSNCLLQNIPENFNLKQREVWLLLWGFWQIVISFFVIVPNIQWRAQASGAAGAKWRYEGTIADWGVWLFPLG